MQVYRGLDIGTAKPTPAERAEVAHHLVDVADPSEEWSVQRTQVAARAAIADIEARGQRALLVGGTGLYVRAVVDELADPADRSRACAPRSTRAAADDAGLAARVRPAHRSSIRSPRRASSPGNRRRIVRALEVIELTGRPFSSFGPGIDEYAPPAISVTLVGVWLAARRAGARASPPASTTMRAAGLVDEVRGARRRARCRAPRGEAIGYREVLAHLGGRDPDARRRVRRGGAPHPPLRPPPAGLVPPRPARPLDRRRTARSPTLAADRAGTLGAQRRAGRGGGTVTDLALSKLHATGNDFLVQLALDPIEPELDAGGRRPRCATATAASAPTGSSRSGPGATAPTAR